jgi:hypothetical protein
MRERLSLRLAHGGRGPRVVPSPCALRHVAEWTHEPNPNLVINRTIIALRQLGDGITSCKFT